MISLVVRNLENPRQELDVDPPTLSGRMYAWNLITREGQAAATGLYLYSVEDHASGKRTVGKDGVVLSGPPTVFTAGNIDQFNF